MVYYNQHCGPMEYNVFHILLHIILLLVPSFDNHFEIKDIVGQEVNIVDQLQFLHYCRLIQPLLKSWVETTSGYPSHLSHVLCGSSGSDPIHKISGFDPDSLLDHVHYYWHTILTNQWTKCPWQWWWKYTTWFSSRYLEGLTVHLDYIDCLVLGYAQSHT